ncbi:hypothetical protein EON66_02185 [archaeon]|nr:MAG: hypothetical protein EON66_02185 [archaeon]
MDVPLSSAQAGRRVAQHSRALTNRLKSIVRDAACLSSIAEYFALPIILNKRAGEWYAPPANCLLSPRDAHSDACRVWYDQLRACAAAHGCAYFKSTDGHVSHWTFSHTRLNCNVITTAIDAGGVVLVDATRAGKSFPDALTRTLPIWAAIMNCVLLCGEGEHSAQATHWQQHLCLPHWVPDAEYSLLCERLPSLAASVSPTLRSIIREAVGGRLTKPLHPLWVNAHEGCVHSCCEESSAYRAARRPVHSAEDCIPLVCVSASAVVPPEGDVLSAHEGWVYVPGAGDDAENWACGLTPATLWSTAYQIFADPSDDAMARALEDVLVHRSDAHTDAGAPAGGFAATPPASTPHVVTVRMPGSSFGVCMCATDDADAVAPRVAEGGQPDGGVPRAVAHLCVVPLTSERAASAAPEAALPTHVVVTDTSVSSLAGVGVSSCHATRVAVPVTKAQWHKHKTIWTDTILPSVCASLPHGSPARHLASGDAALMSVCASHAGTGMHCMPGEDGAAPLAIVQFPRTLAEAGVTIASALLLHWSCVGERAGARLGGGVAKEDVRVTVAMVLAAAGLPSLPRNLMQQLNRHFCSPPAATLP